MFDHVGLRVRDARASARFYTSVLHPLGIVPDATGIGFGPAGAPALWLYEVAEATEAAQGSRDGNNIEAVYLRPIKG